jgi:hypothetical protein
MRGCALLPKVKEDGGKEDEKGVSAAIQEEMDDEAALCIVCMADKKDTLFYKCGHVGMHRVAFTFLDYFGFGFGYGLEFSFGFGLGINFVLIDCFIVCFGLHCFHFNFNLFTFALFLTRSLLLRVRQLNEGPRLPCVPRQDYRCLQSVLCVIMMMISYW